MPSSSPASTSGLVPTPREMLVLRALRLLPPEMQLSVSRYILRIVTLAVSDLDDKIVPITKNLLRDK